MGNCFKKQKFQNSSGLEAEIYFLQKQNLRCFDTLLAELKSLKSPFYDIDSQNLSQNRNIVKNDTLV